MIKNWAMLPNFMEEVKIDSLINYIEDTYELTDGQTIGGSLSTERKCKIAWVGRSSEDSFINSMIWAFALSANSEAFGFDIQMLPSVQYTVYESDAAGEYDWHMDCFFSNTHKMYDRKLTFILQLSNSDEYEGGDLVLDKQFLLTPPDTNEMRSKGTAFIFPSFINHRVTPVTKGTRKSLVAWIEGPKFR